MDLDADSKLTKEEFLEGIHSEEPFSRMIVREAMTRKAELRRISKQNKEEEKRGRRTDKKKEYGLRENPVNDLALEKSYKDVLSTSPLKYRVDYDLRRRLVRVHEQNPSLQQSGSKSKL